MNECLQYDDCLYNLFYWLDVKHIIQCSLVNKQFLNISQHELLWKKLYDFNIPCHQHYYQNYKKYYQLNHFLFYYKNKSLNESLQLRNLYLYKKQLKTIPSEIGQLKQLQYLHLSHNKLTDISALCHCQQLQTLYLNHNQLTDISSLNQLKQLRDLNLNHNKLTDITSLGQCQQLRDLNLSHNQLTDISALSQCQQLRYLHLSHNQLTDITALVQCQQLRELDISLNQFTDISLILSQLLNLTRIFY